jgi:hypothetical protein
VGINVLAMSCMIAVHIMYKRENKRRDELLAQTGEPLVVDPDSDLTDRENTNFRYTC